MMEVIPVHDPAGPQGELLLGGPFIADGYFKCDSEEDRRSFFVDKEGTKWFRTGDIGFIDKETNTLSIIDRKKFLVKVQNGEFLSLSKIEAIMCEHTLVDMACVVVDPFEKFPMALVVPDFEKLWELCQEELLIKQNLSRIEMCSNKAVKEYFSKELSKYMESRHLFKFEIPKAIYLIKDNWLPETGLVTGAMKLRRQFIYRRYQKEIESMKKSIGC